MRRIVFNITIGLALFILSSSIFASQANAQVFKFELANPSQAISAGADFQVKIMINTAGEQVINGDALIIFEDSKVSIKSAQTGNFFTYFSPNPITGTNNKYLISSWEESIAHAKSASTDTLFATLTLNAKAEGTTTLSFECTSGIESESNINRASDSADIIKCPLDPLSINIGAGGPTSTPGPTTAPTVVPSPTSVPTVIVPTSTAVPPTKAPLPTTTVSTIPRAGVAEITVATLGIGTLLTFMGILFIL